MSGNRNARLTETSLVSTRDSVAGLKSFFCHLQKLMPISQVRLKMIPLRPLIPSIDEHKRLWQLVKGLLISKHGAQPVTVGGWSGAVEDVCAA